MSIRNVKEETIKKLMASISYEIDQLENPAQKASLERRLEELWIAIGQEDTEQTLWQINATTFLV